MLWLAVTNIATEFDLYLRFGSVALGNCIHSLTHELDFNCARRQIGSVKMAFLT